MNNDRGLQGKVIIITGGCGDIGGATTRKLAALGARVVVWDIVDKEAGEARVKELGGVEYGRVDQGNATQVHEGVADVGKRFGRLDIVIGNAAYLPALGRLFDRTAADWQESFRINVIGCAMLAQAAVKIMLAQTPDVDGVRGKPLFTSSWVGTYPYPGSIDYCASKVALNHLVRMVAQRIADPRVLRLIQQWLKAGVLEGGEWHETVEGTPQGAGISPLLANIFLHYVLGLWVHQWRKRKARGRVINVR